MVVVDSDFGGGLNSGSDRKDDNSGDGERGS